jgi:hypothetical protein
MLASHRDKSVRRPPKAGNIEAVVTRDGRVLVRHPNRFHGNHGLQTRPSCRFRKGCEVGDGPDPPPHRAAVRVIEGIKEILDGAPVQMVFDVLMKVLFDCRIRLFVTLLLDSRVLCDQQLNERRKQRSLNLSPFVETQNVRNR